MNESDSPGERAERKIQPKLLLAIAVAAASMLLLSAFVNPMTRGLAQASDSMEMNGAAKLPQPNDPEKIVHAKATNALYQPSAGKSHVFSPDGLFPFFNDTFSCGDSLSCGVSAGNEAKFEGTFEQGNMNNLTGYTATYTVPITYGPQQMANHTYKIVLTDTLWNSTDATIQTRQAEFTKMVNNVGFDQIQHGASNVDRSDVPQLHDLAFLYGHAEVIDVTNGNNTMVAKDVFTHVMVAHVMDESSFYRSLKNDAASPIMVFLFAINIPSGIDLPGDVPALTPEQAISFTPLPTDPSLSSPPPVAYPVQTMTGAVEEPQPQSTPWPVDNPDQPLLFNFLVYQDAEVSVKSMSSSDMDGEGGAMEPHDAMLTVEAFSPATDSEPRMYVTIYHDSNIVKAGYTPLEFAGEKGITYTVRAANFDGIAFDRWDDGSMEKSRMVTLDDDTTTITAYYQGTPVSKNVKLEEGVRAFLNMLQEQNAPPINTLPPDEARMVLSKLQSMPPELPPADIEDRMIPGPDGSEDIAIKIYRPQGNNDILPAVMYFHGGGWVTGGADTHDRLMRELATQAEAAVIYVNYTLSPEAHYPVANEQAYEATNWVAQHGDEINVDSSRLAVAGDSAGGNMATVVAMMAKERGGPEIDFQALFYPVTDGTNFDTPSYLAYQEGYWLTRDAMMWFWDNYAPDESVRSDPKVSPLLASNEQLQGLPPALVITNEFDVLRDEGEAYAHKLMQAGVTVTATRYLGTIHDMMMLNPLADTPASQEATAQAAEMLKKALE